jgi:hypothetical protein
MLLRGWQAMLKVTDDEITKQELRSLIAKTRNFLETEFGVTGIPTNDLDLRWFGTTNQRS